MATKTIAILSDSEGLAPEFFEVLGSSNHRLLFVVGNAETKEHLQKSLNFLKLKAEIDFIGCEKDGCWEADKILISMQAPPSKDMIKKVKEVATQKPVWVISPVDSHGRKVDLQQQLPNSRVVEISIQENLKEVSLSSKEVVAKQEIRQLFEASGYTVN